MVLLRNHEDNSGLQLQSLSFTSLITLTRNNRKLYNNIQYTIIIRKLFTVSLSFDKKIKIKIASGLLIKDKLNKCKKYLSEMFVFL